MRQTFGLLVLLSLVGGCAEPEPDAATDDSVGTAEVDPDADAPPVPLPAGGEDWDFVGTFRLSENGQAATVRLYVFDSDSAAGKAAKRGELGLRYYPNHFMLHAFYRAGDAGWSHREVYGGARTRFVGVKARRAAAVDLELGAKFMADLSQGDLQERLAWAERANRPYMVRLTLEDGVPVARPITAEPGGAPDRGGIE
jgi:hypothetical protein